MRNRERAHNYYQRFSSSDQMGAEEPGSSSPANSNTPLKSSNLIDHRSISSSHLMPAFAKRRFVIATGDGSSELTEPEKAVEDDGRKDNSNFHSMRSSRNALSSPMRIAEPNLVSNEWERNNLKDMEQSTASSPTYVSGRQSGERRIGSGRLLPRNDNWEFNKNQDTNNRLDIDKLQNNGSGSIINQQRQRTYSGKQQGDRLGGININNEHVREPIEVKRNNVQGGGGRRTANKDKFNFSDTSSHQSRGRRGPHNYHMHDRHEPEWFSAGPTSQLETIDLHGFDDSEEEDTASPPAADEATISATSAAAVGQSRSSSVDSLTKLKLQHANKKNSNEQTNNSQQGQQDSKSEAEFNFEVYLNMDPMEHSSLMVSAMKILIDRRAELSTWQVLHNRTICLFVYSLTISFIYIFIYIFSMPWRI